MPSVRLLRLVLAAVIFPIFVFYFNFAEEGIYEGYFKDKSLLRIDELRAMKSPILYPGFIRKHMLPDSITFKNKKWVRAYRFTPASFLKTQLYSELSERVPEKPRFSSGQYMRSAREALEKEKADVSKGESLFYLEELFRLTADPSYLKLFMLASKDLISLLRTHDKPFWGHEIFTDEAKSFLLLRAVSFRLTREASRNPGEFGDEYRAYLSARAGSEFNDKTSIDSQCSLLWSMEPLLISDTALREGLQHAVLDLAGRYVSVLNEDVSQFTSLAGVLRCLRGFTELSSVYAISAEELFTTAYQRYIQHTLNYPPRENCPPAGGFFEKIADLNTCREYQMTLSDNIQISLLLYYLHEKPAFEK
jgi:hypothetical protein